MEKDLENNSDYIEIKDEKLLNNLHIILDDSYSCNRCIMNKYDDKLGIFVCKKYSKHFIIQIMKCFIFGKLLKFLY